jgi:hypothetical protein
MGKKNTRDHNMSISKIVYNFEKTSKRREEYDVYNPQHNCLYIVSGYKCHSTMSTSSFIKNIILEIYGGVGQRKNRHNGWVGEKKSWPCVISLRCHPHC